MKGKKTYYITTPIYYPSDKLHIGHTYTTVAADAAARFKRMQGYDVMFLTGTDEHGQKIQRKAEEKGVAPKEYVDEIVSGIKELWELMQISNDRFIRTTDKQHEETVQKIFKKLYDQGDIYKSEYEGWYCTPCESFWAERQLIDGKCPDCGREVELTKEESYFFKLSKYQDRLIKHIEENPGFIQPQTRQNEMLNNFLRPGLEDLCVSRTSFNWGVPVSFDEKHVVYVWIDALSNYITALGFSSEDDSDYKRYWPADVHLVGKEIVRFHTIIWPIMLMALGEPLPKQVFGHGWLILEGGKMSKSKGNVVDPVILVQKYGVDAIRYFLLREVPFGSDGIYSEEALVNRLNSDLANDLGNLLSRTLTMIDKYFSGSVPIPENTGDPLDASLIELAETVPSKVGELMDNLLFSNALAEIWRLIGRANKYIDETMPWVLAKDEAKKERLATVLYNLAEVLRMIAVLIEPFMPNAPVKIFDQLGVDDESLKTWESIKNFGVLKAGTITRKGEIIFPRVEFAKENNATPQAHKGDKYITIDDFAKIDLRVAKVLECEKIKGSSKLLRLQLEVGSEKRQVVSGISEYYSPVELIGKSVVLVANLKPVKLCGVESNGMILAADDGKDVVVVTPLSEIPSGSQVR
ncbi:MAG TPA: methionine--tRNA ligase [Bacillota bacterium]|nr:methionine--tRNA ligase [Bacillota bacterium]